MWKERLQQLGQRRNQHKRGSPRDRSSRLRSNTAAAAISVDDIAPARDLSRTTAEGPTPVARAPTMDSHGPHPVPPSKVSLKAWWNHFNFAQKARKEAEEKKGEWTQVNPCENVVFGKPLKESLKYANVQISTANSNGDLYVWGYIPVVVAKCGLYLKETATEVQGTFRISGSAKRMRDLQAEFEKPPRYGKNLDWRHEHYTPHDVASVFRRFLTQMPEPVIPYDMYHSFRDTLAKKPFNQDEIIATYKRLIRSLPRPNQYLLLYVLDLLHVFSRKSDKNLMDAKNLAVIFRPALLSHPSHELSPKEHQLSQDVLEFLIHHQDWFMLDIPPAPSLGHGGPAGAPLSSSMSEAVDIMPSSDEDSPGGWRLVDKDTLGTRRISRRRTTTERSGDSGNKAKGDNVELSPVLEAPPSRSSSMRTATTISRSRTLPPSRNRLEGSEDERSSKLIKKHKRASMQQRMAVSPAG
ncbi:hypothetical protein QCA50_005553 [Cerrena zonata]|uniref:Rho-GAP domain-containing protein n=1 Tax=Cerrena zonata TaxID=2478898 RepID=A0AAW0GH15_9APHY